jgi:hypothetical protein
MNLNLIQLFLLISSLFASTNYTFRQPTQPNQPIQLNQPKEIIVRLENPPAEMIIFLSSGDTITYDLGTTMNLYTIEIREIGRGSVCVGNWLLGYTDEMNTVPTSMKNWVSATCTKDSVGIVTVHREYCPLYLKFFGLYQYGNPTTMSYKLNFKISAYDKKAEICKSTSSANKISMGTIIILMFIYILF